MKRKSIIILVFTVMVLAIVGVGFIISINIPVVKAAFTASDAKYTLSAIQFLISAATIFICWGILLVIFIRLLKSDNFIEFGKKDALVNIGNKNYLENMYKNQVNQGSSQQFLVYFAFSTKKIIEKYDVIFSNQIQKTSANILCEACLSGEYAARLGDGEFAVIISAANGVRAQQRVLELVNKLNQCQFKAVFEIPAQVQSGFYGLPEKRPTFVTALQNARAAYSHAVNHSVDTYVYSEDMLNLTQTNIIRAQQLREAISNKEFEVYMQFIYDVKQHKFIGVEALSRWLSNDGLVMPATYIGEMHTCGVIMEFDMYMFEKICNILQNWKDDPDFKEMSVSCNITRETISSASFLMQIKEIANRYDFPHEKLIIEITEDALIDDLEVAFDNMGGCRNMGFEVALDDFGAGHTSFSDINNYPFDQLKIDRQFTKNVTTERGFALMSAFVDMAHKLNISVVCEGVETKEQLNAIKKLNIEYVQGHYYSYVYSMKEIREKYARSLK